MRCPNCGYDETSYHPGQSEYFQRAMDQQLSAWSQQGMGAGAGMNNDYRRAHAMQNAAYRTEIEIIAEPKPEPKPTAWAQFKKAVREMFP